MSKNKILVGKIALITGASRGIGAAIALAYAKNGAHVILTARTLGALEEMDDKIKASGGTCTLVPLDLKEFEKIDQLGGIIAQKYGKLDVLVGNAAILGSLGPMAHIEPKIWQEVMDINVTANYRLLRSFDALLKAGKETANVIFVTSGVALKDKPYWGAYSVSKAALEKIAGIYAKEVENSNVKVNLVDPGVVRTKMRQEAMPGEDPDKLPHPEDITNIFVDIAAGIYPNPEDNTGKLRVNAY